MIKFSLKNHQMICIGIEEMNIQRMAEGDPVYVLAEALQMPMDLQLTIGKQSPGSFKGRNCFIVDLSDETVGRLRDGGVIHIEANNYWTVPDTYIFYGKDVEDLRGVASLLVLELTGTTFIELFGKDMESFYPIPKGMESYAELKPDGLMESGVRSAHHSTFKEAQT